jgi:hypothetical protein
MAVGMNSDITAVALLILCTSMRRRGAISGIRNPETGLELETGLVIPTKSSTWQQMPDLEFRSDAPMNPTGHRIHITTHPEDVILPAGAETPRRSMIGLGIRRSWNWITPRNSRISTGRSVRISREDQEIWGIRAALAATKDLPPLPR